MSSLPTETNRPESDAALVKPPAGHRKAQAVPADLQQNPATFGADNKLDGYVHEGAFDSKECSHNQVMTDHTVITDTAGGKADGKTPAPPEFVQDSGAAAPLVIGEEPLSPGIEPTVNDADTASITSDFDVDEVSRRLEKLKASSMNDPPEYLSTSSTAGMKEELSKYKSIGDSALRLCPDLRAILAKNPENGMRHDRKRLELSMEEIESIVKSLRSSRKSSKSSEAARNVDILYRARLIEQGNSDRYWYQDVPFSGIDLEQIEPTETEYISIFDVIVDVDGKIEIENVPPDEKRETWKGRKNFEFGKDISITRQQIPAIIFKAPLLLSALKCLINYYPSQAGDMSFVPHPYKMLLQHYPMLAAFRSTYKGTNKAIAGHLMVTNNKLQVHEPASISRSHVSIVGPGEKNTMLGNPIQTQKNARKDPSTIMATSDSHFVGKHLMPEQQIKQILDLKTSLEVETEKP